MSKQLVEYLLGKLVDQPDRVSVKEERDENSLTFFVTVAEEDRGKVIGRGGRTSQALRSVVRAAGALNDDRYQLEIVDAEND